MAKKKKEETRGRDPLPNEEKKVFIRLWYKSKNLKQYGGKESLLKEIYKQFPDK